MQSSRIINDIIAVSENLVFWDCVSPRLAYLFCGIIIGLFLLRVLSHKTIKTPLNDRNFNIENKQKPTNLDRRKGEIIRFKSGSSTILSETFCGPNGYD